MSGIPSWAVPGAKVVCVDGANRQGGYGWEAWPATGLVYTIRSTEWSCAWNVWQVRLVEIINPPALYSIGFVETGFGLHRFRPLVTQYTEQHDVAKFRDVLTAREPA